MGRVSWTRTPTINLAIDGLVAAPSAGADINANNPGSGELIAWAVTLTTSATAGTRTPVFQITDPSGNVMYQIAAPAVSTISTTYAYSLAAGVNLPVSAASPFTLPIPAGLVLGVNYKLKTLTAGLLAGDQWSSSLVQIAQ